MVTAEFRAVVLVPEKLKSPLSSEIIDRTTPARVTNSLNFNFTGQGFLCIGQELAERQCSQICSNILLSGITSATTFSSKNHR